MEIDKNLLKRIELKKKELDSLRPFSNLALKRLKKRFDILLSYNSNAIEGNTLNESETRLVIEEGMTIGGKSLKEHFEAKNHKKAIDFVELIVDKKKKINKEILCKLNELILEGIMDEEIGIYRKRRVYVEGASFIPAKPDIIEKQMNQFFKWLIDFNKNIIIKTAVAHEKFTLIHPFIDGNGRIARLLSNLILMKQGYPPIIILKTERKKYISTLDKAHNLNYKPFINFIARCVERSFIMYLDVLKIPDPDEDYKKISEIANSTKYSSEYISLLARKGRIGALKTRRNWLVSKKSLDDYIKTKRKYNKKV
jgi:excisionase family DNA binding protein